MTMKREEFQNKLENDKKLLARFQENPIEVCSEHGIELTEDELEQISGGWGGNAQTDGTTHQVGVNFTFNTAPDDPGKDKKHPG